MRLKKCKRKHKQFYCGDIQTLRKNQVFVFGSNLSGFHGAGAAGFASFGVRGNCWREMGYGQKLNGWKGKWNVKGVAEGLQAGREGLSYAIPTVTQPGAKRSLAKRQIADLIAKMYKVACANPEKQFLVAGTAKPGLNGYSAREMAEMYCSAGPIPKNVLFNKDMWDLIEEKG